jgi:hypothetical protein
VLCMSLVSRSSEMGGGDGRDPVVLELDRTVAGGDRTGAPGLNGRVEIRRGEGVRRGSAAGPRAAGDASEATGQGALTCEDEGGVGGG